MELWYSIVELLPFSWAAEGSMYFMKNALLALLVVSPLFGILSTMVVTRHMSFFSDALGHSALTGVAIGSLCGLAEPLWGAVIFAALLALLFTFVRRRTSLASDTVIGVFSSTAVALGIFIATFGGGSFTKFNSYLIGDILSVTPGKTVLLALILLGVLLLWGFFYNKLMLSAVHPALAGSRGINIFLAGCAVFRGGGCSGHSVHDLGGPAGHQLPAGPSRRRSPESGQKYVAVSPAVPIGRCGGRSGWPVDQLLCRLVHRRVHHTVLGSMVRPYFLYSEKMTAAQKRPEAPFVRASGRFLWMVFPTPFPPFQA